MICKWLKRYDDGERDRWQDFLYSSDVADKPEPWSLPYAFLRHNGWDDAGCGGWPLTYLFHTKGTYPRCSEWSWGIDPNEWTIGFTFFKDTERRYTVNPPMDLSIKQVIFQLGPLSLGRLRYRPIEDQHESHTS